jgi:predicted nucleotidyltransferase component of viral defense system
MPEQFLHLSAEDRKEILQTAAAQLGQQATALEKDVWICWTLQILFSLPDRHPMAFKGGTSLSKVYGVIERFSEDGDPLSFDEIISDIHEIENAINDW